MAAHFFLLLAEEREILTTVTHERIRLSKPLADNLRDNTQHLVAGVMAKRVIDPFEMIYIQQCQRERVVSFQHPFATCRSLTVSRYRRLRALVNRSESDASSCANSL